MSKYKYLEYIYKNNPSWHCIGFELFRELQLLRKKRNEADYVPTASLEDAWNNFKVNTTKS